MANPSINLGNGNWSVKESKLLGSRPIKDKIAPIEFDVTRASTATRVNKQGLIETVNSNIARIDYSSDAKGALLLEPQSTNLITYSEDFSNAIYIKDSGVSTGTTNNLSPKGNLSATKINVTNNGRIYLNANSATYVSSIFIKAGVFSYFRFNATDVDLVLKTISNGTIEEFKNGWFRISVSYTGNRPFQIQSYPNSSYSNHTTNGDYYIWGAQVEENSFSTSYIPTLTGTTQTRVAETCGGAGDSSSINSEEGVLYAEIKGLADLVSSRLSINDGTNLNTIQLAQSTTISNNYTFSNASGTFNKNFTVSDITDYHKIAIKYELNNYSVWVDGVEVATDTLASVFPIGTLDNISFDRGDGSFKTNSKIRTLAVYNTALTDSELAILTTI